MAIAALTNTSFPYWTPDALVVNEDVSIAPRFCQGYMLGSEVQNLWRSLQGGQRGCPASVTKPDEQSAPDCQKPRYRQSGRSMNGGRELG
jgi:hypothetical protein